MDKTFGPSRQDQGFTLVEVMAVLAVLGLLVVLSMSTFSDYLKRQQYKTEANEVMRTIVEQRTKAVSSFLSSEHGFSVGTSSVTAFSGSSFDFSAVSNRVINLNYSEATSSLSAFGVPTTTVYFQIRTGQASATGTIELYSDTVDVGTSTITIHESGLVEQN